LASVLHSLWCLHCRRGVSRRYSLREGLHVSVSCYLSAIIHSGSTLPVDVIDGVLDYPTWYQLFPAFQTSTGNLSALAEVVHKAQLTYKTGLFGSGAFSENHDQPRFPSLTSDTAVSTCGNRGQACAHSLQRIKNVITFPFIHDGIPILYYGMSSG
jgi:alpha-amylase